MTSHSFTELSRLAKKAVHPLREYKLAVMGDCATQHLSTALKGWAYLENIKLSVFDADYDQIFGQVMDTSSELYCFVPDSILIYMCVEKIYTAFFETSEEQRSKFADMKITEIEYYWNLISKNSRASILIFNFPGNNDFVYGNFGAKHQSSFIYQLRKLNYLLSEAASERKDVFIADLCSLQEKYGRQAMYDPKLYYIAKMPLSMAALPVVAKEVIGIIKTLRGSIKKCVVCDLDNTLWGGVIGDDGISGIQLGELGAGSAFTDLQLWLRELKNRGIILAVCSKNEEDVAKEPFIKHDEMVLRLEDISVFVANWDDKANNIRRIRDTLNIGLDSIVFIDDNPFEREAVKNLIPEVTVPDLPEDPALYLSQLKSLNLFEMVSYSDEDKIRTEHYKAIVESVAVASTYSNYGEYLQSLDMVAEAKPFDEYHYPRIAQLTQRSNQFNLRTIRYTESEIKAAAENASLITLYFTLKDNISDHGLIGVVIMEKLTDADLFVSEWLMSCRVLKRGMEEFIVNKIISTAKLNGFKTVHGEYCKTAKNAMVADIYEKLGFTSLGEGRFSVETDAFRFNKNFIREV